MPAHVQAATTLTLHSSDPVNYEWDDDDITTDGNVNPPASVRIGSTTATPEGVVSQAIFFRAPTNDKNRDPDTVTLTVYSGSAGSANEEDVASVTFADLNALPMVRASVMLLDEDGDAVDPQPDPFDSVMEGQAFSLQLTVVNEDGDKMPATEALSVMLDPTGSADEQDYRVSAPLTIANGAETSNTVTVTVTTNQEVNPEMLVFDAVVNGDVANDTADESVTSPDVVTLAIVDGTQKQVQAKSMEDVYAVLMTATDMAGEDGVNPGETVRIPVDEMFVPTTGFEVSYAFTMESSDAASASLSGDNNLVVEAMAPGQAKFTVTATASPMASSVEIVDQTRANSAQVIFPVDVVLAPFADTMISAEPMTIEEGESSTITAMLSRMVHANDGTVAINLTASGGTLSADSIEIEAGMQSGTAMLMTEADDNYEGGTVTVVASGTGIDGNAAVMITLTDSDEEPVPPEPTNVVTAKSSDDIYPMLMAAGLAGDDAMFNPGMMAELDASMMFDVMDGYAAGYAAESDAMDVASTSVSGSMVTVTAGEAGMAHVVITATATMASGVMPGQPATNVATVMFPVNVVNMPLSVTVSTDPMDMVEEGGTIMVTATANRDVVAADGDVEVMLTVTGAVEMNEVTIAIAAGSSNTAMIQVLDDNEVAPMADITIVATGSGIATAQTFTIAVTEDDSARTFTLSAADDMMQLVEGGDGVELTVTADPAVSVDTEVTIMVDRAASTADADDFTAAAITINAGEASGTTTLMATEDMMDDSGHASPEMLVVFAMADNTQSNTVSFYIWDMAVPALPLIAQLLLAAFLAIGGYRRYLRR